MENLETGNYARTGAGIKKIIEVIKTPSDFSIKGIKNEEGLFINIKYIKRAESSIMKLIEKGDYVNGKRVDRITDTNLGLEYCEECGLFAECILKEEEIIDVLTKEQFSSRKFKAR